MLDQIAVLKSTQELPGMVKGLKDLYPDKFPTTKRDQKIYWVIQHIYQQQKYTYDNNTHSVADRIVNIYQPYIRPIPRGKDKQATEFGAKISASEVGGISRVEHISWNQFNESTDLELQVTSFKNTHGHYPELLLADKIYLNRKNRAWLKSKNFRIVGKPFADHPKNNLGLIKNENERKSRAKETK